jgi:membrane-bound lytic murein transglycosylase B
MMPVRLSRRAVLAAPLAAVALGDGKAGAAEGEFSGFLAGVRRDAVAHGVRAATVDLVFRYVDYLPKVIELDRHQPEHKLTFGEFIAKFVTPQRTEEGRRALAENWPLLERVHRSFRVQPRFVVALWGIESAFGKITGNYFVPAALATLAYDGRRGALFRAELIDALRILDAGHIRIDAMLGSWAGAMGQCQFMPSTFLRYAVDFDGDGRRDIWGDRADVLGSIANYIGQLGWRGDEGWGRAVSVPPNFDARSTGLDVRRPVSEWGRLGVRPLNAAPLAGREMLASVVLPDGAGGPALLVYDNFRAIMRWNKSTFFAAAVGYLADSLDRG